MAESARLTSLAALPELKTALLRFAADVEAAVVALELESRRPIAWVEEDRTRYWPDQARRATDAVAEARQALARCEQHLAGDDRRSCYDERKALEQAKRRQQLTEEKIEAVRRWRVRLRKETEEFQVQLAAMQQYLESDFVQALSALDRMIAALDHYAESQPTFPKP